MACWSPNPSTTLIKAAYDDGILVLRNAALFGGTTEKPGIAEALFATAMGLLAAMFGVWLSAAKVSAESTTWDRVGPEDARVKVDETVSRERETERDAAYREALADAAREVVVAPRSRLRRWLGI